GCATCHDHKFDPIKMKDFYAFTAFFRNNTAPLLDQSTNANVPPLLVVPKPEDRRRWLELEQQVSQKQQQIENRKTVAQPLFEEWLTTPSNLVATTAPGLNFPLDESQPPYHGKSADAEIQWPGSNEQRPGPFGPAPRVSGGVPVEKVTANVY